MILTNKTVLITGAAIRVGRAIAVALAKRGARIAVHYNNSRVEAERLVAELRTNYRHDAISIKADLAHLGQTQKMAASIAQHWGTIDVLINSAAIYKKTSFGHMSPKDWDTHMDINARAPMFLSQAVAPYMRKQKAGKIINIADWMALRPYTDFIPYCASKAALLCINTALAKALAPKIQVNAIMPGPVLPQEKSAPRQRHAMAQATLLKRLGTPEDIAHAVLFLIEADFITGTVLPVDGGRLIA